MGLTKDLKACDFFAPDVWWRGVVDLVIIKDDKAFLVDYKTGKSSKYADTKQLEILALALFVHFPQIKRIKAGLLFVVANDFVKVDYDTSAPQLHWVKWMRDTAQLEAAYENDVWNARPNFSCKQYCAVTSCPHNGRHN
jgi:RecB family exonuclease